MCRFMTGLGIASKEPIQPFYFQPCSACFGIFQGNDITIFMPCRKLAAAMRTASAP
jgi:hypothetical protein